MKKRNQQTKQNQLVDTRPSAKEVDGHMREQTPYRNWCHHCIAGRCINDRRSRQTGEGGCASNLNVLLFNLHANGEERENMKEDATGGATMGD